MAVFVYTAQSSSASHGQAVGEGNGVGIGGAWGGTVRGSIQADSARAARDQLRARGLLVRELVQSKARSGQGRWTGYLVNRHRSEVTSLLQEMATLLGAGIPLLEALDTIGRQHQGRFAQVILLLRDHVAGGGSLTSAMAEQPGLFDELCLNIVEVGENAGTLDVSLARLVEFRRKWSGLQNRVMSALIYPCIVLSMGVVLSVFMMMYVMPNLLGVLVESGKPLPTVTLVVKGMSDVLVGWWWLMLIGVGLLVMGVRGFLRRERGRRWWHEVKLRLPVVGDLIRKQAIARMSMVLATLLKSDLAFVKAVQIAQRTVSNEVLREALVACEKAVLAGRDIAPALEETKAFPPLVIQVFAVGQASGKLETMLENLAADYDVQVDIATSRLTALLEPVMMVLLAIGVGFFAFATILPILEAGDVL